jgi:hypothetical protein
VCFSVGCCGTHLAQTLRWLRSSWMMMNAEAYLMSTVNAVSLTVICFI